MTAWGTLAGGESGERMWGAGRMAWGSGRRVSGGVGGVCFFGCRGAPALRSRSGNAFTPCVPGESGHPRPDPGARPTPAAGPPHSEEKGRGVRFRKAVAEREELGAHALGEQKPGGPVGEAGLQEQRRARPRPPVSLTLQFPLPRPGPGRYRPRDNQSSVGCH